MDTASSIKDQRIQNAKKQLKSFRAKQARAKNQSAGNALVSAPVEQVSAVVAAVAASHARSHSRSQSRSTGPHARGHSRAASISLSPAVMAAVASASASAASASSAPRAVGRPLSFVASTPSVNASMTMAHARTHSRSTSRSNNRLSRPVSMIGLGSAPSSDSVVTLAIEMPPDAVGGGKASDWVDENSTLAAPISTDRPVSTSSTLSNLSAASGSTAAAGAAPRSRTSIIQERRMSRHGRQSSISTKRESMEIMGGLGFVGTALNAPTGDSLLATRASRRASGARFSGVLGGADHARLSAREEDEEEDGHDRQSALEKLEGRSRSVSPQPPLVSDNNRLSVASSHRDSAQRLSTGSTVQLPSFDEVHGDEGMDKRASVSLLEHNELTTSSQTLPLGSSVSWDTGLSAVGSGDGMVGSGSGNLLSSRPSSMYMDNAAIEGLGTLVEEDEEEEPTLIRVHASKKSLEQEEAIKRNRRASLTPKPLKLKSRPASLFISPALRSANNGFRVPPSHTVASVVKEEDEEVNVTEEDLPTARPYMSTPGTGEASAAWRSKRASMPYVPVVDSTVTAVTVPSGSSAAPSLPRQGMRALRLGSGNVTSPVNSPVAPSFAALGAPSSKKSHGSDSSVASLSSVSTATGRATKEDVGAGLPSATVTSATMSPGRRSSIVYRTGNSIGPLSTSSSSLGDGRNPRDTFSSSPATETVTSPPDSPPSAPSKAAFEELRSRAARDAELLVANRAQVARLQRELKAENERSAREYAELERRSAEVYAELERWSKEEKQTLGERIAQAEARGAELETRALDAEKALQDERLLRGQDREDLESKVEDLVAEKDMYAEDVEGWRTRCKDIEAKTAVLQRGIEDGKQREANNMLQIEKLNKALLDAGITPPEDKLVIEETVSQFDLMNALRSPAIMQAAAGASGYFPPMISPAGAPMLAFGRDHSPRPSGGHSSAGGSRDVSPISSVSVAPQVDPAATVKLLQEMRQRIFDLGGSLEHERREHLKAREELRRLRTDSGDGPEADMEVEDSLLSSPDASVSHGVGAMSSPPRGPPSTIRNKASSGALSNSTISSTESTATKPKRHVFAYDSSMGSFGHDSVRTTGSTTVSMEGGSLGHGVLDHDEAESGEKDARFGGGQTFEELEEASRLRGLDTLQEEDEIEEARTSTVVPDDVDSRSATSSFMETNSAAVDHESGPGMHDRAISLDLEAGHADADAYLSSDGEVEIMPPTPALDHHDGRQSPDQQAGAYASIARMPHTDMHIPAQAMAAFRLPTLKVDGRSIDSDDRTRSSESSLESQGPPSPPMRGQHDIAPVAVAAQDANDVQQAQQADEHRPEFIREWSFSRAAAKAASKSATRRRGRTPSTAHLVLGDNVLSNEPIEDFFGILTNGTLPPLPASSHALDMPPVYVERDAFPAYDCEPTPHYTPLNGVARVTAGPTARRPPVARSAYVRDSFDHTGEEVGGTLGSSSASLHGSGSAGSAGSMASITSSAAAAAATAGLGSRALSRMSLQGISSAFSGLGGYLSSSTTHATGPLGAAVGMAASVTQTCTNTDPLSPLEESAHENAYKRAVSQQQKAPKRFIGKGEIERPRATPAHLLDFSRATKGGDLLVL